MPHGFDGVRPATEFCPMKICYCTLGFPPATGLGGPTLNAYYLTKTLVARGNTVTVACTNLASRREKLFPETRRLLYEGVEVIYFNTYRLIPLGLHSFGLTVPPGMVSFFKREIKDYDVLHMDGHRGLDCLVGAYYCRKHKVPYVIQERGGMKPAHSSLLAKHTYDWLFGRRILDGCSLFIASSTAEVSDYKGFVKPGQKVVVIPNGLNIAEYAKLPEKGIFRRQHGIGEPKVVTYLGRLHAQKGIDHLVRAFAGSRFRGESRLAIIGPDDGYRENLLALAKQLKLTNSVVFIGPLEGERKLQAFVDSDVVVYAGSSESFGMVPFEAALCGVPTITAEGSACGEILSGLGAGFVVPYGDAARLAQAIDAILGHGQQAAQKVSAVRGKIKEQLSWEQIARQYEEAYQSARSAPRGGVGATTHN
jgi:glycosyltransferase involved in cell wall biosynthesis